MPPTTRLTSALAGRGKAVAAAAAAAGVLAAGGAASAGAFASSPATTAAGTGVLAAAPHGVLATPGATTLNPAAADTHAAVAAPAKTVPVKTVPAKTAQVQNAPARPVAPGKPAAPAKAARAAVPAGPYRVYDSVTPSQIPAGQKVATYADGGYAVNPANVASRGHVLWIDTNGSDPRAAALDVEPGDATPQMAAQWAWHKLHAAAGQVAIIYTMRSEWAATQAAVAGLPAPMQHQVRWWIADPTGVPHIVPGADATQWFWGHGYDITTARPGSGM
jgi:hypothetical protein